MRLLILIMFACSTCYSQVLLSHHNLPILIEKDTVIVNDEVWIESVESEKNQRHKIVVLKRKLDKVRGILKKKEGYEIEIGVLIEKTISLEVERDSLLLIIYNNINATNLEVKQRVVYLSKQLDIVKSQYFVLKEKKRKVWWVATGSIATNALLLVVIIISL